MDALVQHDPGNKGWQFFQALSYSGAGLAMVQRGDVQDA